MKEEIPQQELNKAQLVELVKSMHNEDKKTFKSFLAEKPSITVWGMAWAMYWRAILMVYGGLIVLSLFFALLGKLFE